MSGWTEPYLTPVLPTVKTLTHVICTTFPAVAAGLVIAMKLLEHLTDFNAVFPKGPGAYHTFRTYHETNISKHTFWPVSEYNYKKYSVLFLLDIILCFAHPNLTFVHYSHASNGLIKSHCSG